MPVIHDRRERKLRGIPRRLRSPHRWAQRCATDFPSEDALRESSQGWVLRLPCAPALVEGRQSTGAMRREIAGLLLQACAGLISAKPAWAADCRVSCVICRPDMFSSEICIHPDSAACHRRLETGVSAHGVHTQRIEGRSLAHAWQLPLPTGVGEMGLSIDFPGYGDGMDAYRGEHWVYGEIDA